MTEDIGSCRLFDKRQRGLVERQGNLSRLKLRGFFRSDFAIGAARTAIAMIAPVVIGIVRRLPGMHGAIGCRRNGSGPNFTGGGTVEVPGKGEGHKKSRRSEDPALRCAGFFSAQPVHAFTGSTVARFGLHV